jgi:hypothetical protein
MRISLLDPRWVFQQPPMLNAARLDSCRVHVDSRIS